MPDRRRLEFAALDDVLAEVDRLRSAGYDRAGNWSLAQVCRHLALAFLGTVRRPRVEADPGEPTDEQRAGREAVLDRGQIPEGLPLPSPALAPPEGLDDAEEAAKLRQAIDAYRAEPGPFAPHPRLGPLGRDEWDRFHCVHAAHHLGFLVPKDAG